jgi:hypothetical protein
MLQAQTQTLPDIRVIGNSDLKTYLYKRSLLFSPLTNSTDSLPVFIPMGLRDSTDVKKATPKPRLGYLQFEANAGFGLNSYFSFYPRDSGFHNISHHMNLRAPEVNLLSFQNHLVIGGDMIPQLPVVFKFDHANTKAKDYKGSYFETELTHHRATLDLDFVQLNELLLSFGFTNLRQKIRFDNYNRDYIDFHTRARILRSNLDIKTNVICQAGEVGVGLAPLINWEPGSFSQIRFHILADAYRVIPSLEFNVRHQLSDSGVISISNTPLIESHSFTSLLEGSQWIQFSDAHKLQKSPINLNTSLDYRFPLTSSFSLNKMSISNKTMYDVHSPVLATGATYGVPLVQFVDVASSQTSFLAFFKMRDFSLLQELCVDLAYLPNQSMHRVGYRPILKLETNLDYYANDWVFSIDVIQDYFTKDHTGRNLSESINGNLGVEYRKGDSSLYAIAANIFNHRQWAFSEHPSYKRNIFMGAKHRF